MADNFSRYDVYSVVGSVYCYPESAVLRNKFGITDPVELKKLESDITTVRQYELMSEPIRGHFSAAHLCRIHRHLFGDIYPFAGHYRREDIMKGSTRFIAYNQIKEKISRLLAQLKEEQFLHGLDEDAFVDRTAYYFAELNYIHPFREGNGRATREFMRMLFDHNGYEVNWHAVEHKQLLSVMEASVYDVQPLVGMLKQCLQHK